MRFYTPGAMIGLVALAMAPASAQVTVYSNNFQGNSTLDFSSGLISTTPGTVAHAADNFLGEFGQGASSTTLTIPGLAAHTTATISFDLYMIRSVDGDGQQGGGPDGWSLTGGGNTLLSTNFANYPGGNTQMFQSQANPNAGGQAPYTGSTEQNTLGYDFNGPMDSVYHFNYTFANTDSALSFVFGSSFSEGIGNESWGLDNVLVQTNASVAAATPEPGSFALAATLGIAGIGFLRRRNRRK